MNDLCLVRSGKAGADFDRNRARTPRVERELRCEDGRKWDPFDVLHRQESISFVDANIECAHDIPVCHTTSQLDLLNEAAFRFQ